MTMLLVNGALSLDNTEIDRRILTTFENYCVQYDRIPERLYLTNPTFGAHTAIVIVDTSCRDNNGPNVPVIRLAFYHPHHLSPLHIETDRDFTLVYSAVSEDEDWGDFIVDLENPTDDDLPRDFFERLLAAYPAFSRISEVMAKERIKFFTFPLQSISIG